MTNTQKNAQKNISRKNVLILTAIVGFFFGQFFNIPWLSQASEDLGYSLGLFIREQLYATGEQQQGSIPQTGQTISATPGSTTELLSGATSGATNNSGSYIYQVQEATGGTQTGDYPVAP